MRQYRTSGTVQGAPVTRRSYCETGLSLIIHSLPLQVYLVGVGAHRVRDYSSPQLTGLPSFSQAAHWACRETSTPSTVACDCR